jgi:hypothetical protein
MTTVKKKAPAKTAAYLLACKKIAILTDCNDHTGAIYQLAMLLNENKITTRLQQIEVLNWKLGEMPENLYLESRQIRTKLLLKAKTKLGATAAKKLHDSF